MKIQVQKGVGDKIIITSPDGSKITITREQAYSLILVLQAHLNAY